MEAKEKDSELFNKIISFCKRRGFVYQSSEIYGGMSAIYDYGPYGVEVINTIKALWWKHTVQAREDVVGVDSAIFMSPKVWVASGHVAGFSDPLTECKKCHLRFRADHMLEEIGVQADEKMSEEQISEIFAQNRDKLKCPSCGSQDFTDISKFNLLVKSNLGNFSGKWDSEPVYLRGETCQGIYTNYLNILNSMKVRVPFGIAQIGKAFRNEITARQFIFRTREFEQMELEYFTKPDEEMSEYEKLKETRWKFYTEVMGIKEENLKWYQHENLVFYAKDAYDILYKFPFGWNELEGLHARGDYDLSQHAKFSQKDMNYTDPMTGEKYVPHIVEASSGVGRNFLMLLSEAYTEEKLENGEQRIVMKFNPKFAPVKVAVFPLLRNKPELVKAAKEIFNQLKMEYNCEYDNSGNIGKCYRRQDEIGTPYCVTVDFETLEKGTVTVRDRDTMKQERVATTELKQFFSDKGFR